MNDKRAKKLRRKAFREAYSGHLVRYQSLRPSMVGTYPYQASFLGQVVLDPHCVRATYHRLKRADRRT